MKRLLCLVMVCVLVVGSSFTVFASSNFNPLFRVSNIISPRMPQYCPNNPNSADTRHEMWPDGSCFVRKYHINSLGFIVYDDYWINPRLEGRWDEKYWYAYTCRYCGIHTVTDGTTHTSRLQDIGFAFIDISAGGDLVDGHKIYISNDSHEDYRNQYSLPDRFFSLPPNPR